MRVGGMCVGGGRGGACRCGGRGARGGARAVRIVLVGWGGFQARVPRPTHPRPPAKRDWRAEKGGGERECPRCRCRPRGSACCPSGDHGAPDQWSLFSSVGDSACDLCSARGGETERGREAEGVRGM